MPPAAGRPVVEASSGGELLATDVTFSDLGTPATDPGEQAGVQFNENSSGSLVRTSLLRGTTGLRLDRSVDVRLEAVTVDESAAEGLVLSGDRGTTLVGVKAERNRGNGVLVDGPSTDRPVTGLSTAGNGQYGIAVVGQTAPRIADVTTRADAVGGLRISRSTEARVTGSRPSTNRWACSRTSQQWARARSDADRRRPGRHPARRRPRKASS